MAQIDQNWEQLGQNIQDIVDRAVNSRDFQKLNQTIRQVVDRAADVSGQVVRKTVDSVSETERRIARQTSIKSLYGKTAGKTVGGVLKTVFGGEMSLVSLGLLISALVVSMPGMLKGVAVALLGAWMTGSSWLTFSGIRDLQMLRRFRSYKALLGERTHCTLEKLSRGVGKDVKFVRRELQRMIDRGYFLEGHLDNEGTSLITSHETYRYYEQSRLQLEQRQREAAALQQKNAGRDPKVQAVLDRGEEFVKRIQACNDAIPGKEISDKISRMELIVQRIFQRAEQDPEVVPDLQKLMDYYLPMTVKLLDAYTQMDAQPVQGETIQNSKREIEGTLDTLNQAFEKLLDDLFRDTALDVTSDISVLQTMLAQEGLTEDELTKLKKQQAR